MQITFFIHTHSSYLSHLSHRAFLIHLARIIKDGDSSHLQMSIYKCKFVWWWLMNFFNNLLNLFLSKLFNFLTFNVIVFGKDSSLKILSRETINRWKEEVLIFSCKSHSSFTIYWYYYKFECRNTIKLKHNLRTDFNLFGVWKNKKTQKTLLFYYNATI